MRGVELRAFAASLLFATLISAQSTTVSAGLDAEEVEAGLRVRENIDKAEDLLARDQLEEALALVNDTLQLARDLEDVEFRNPSLESLLRLQGVVHFRQQRYSQAEQSFLEREAVQLAYHDPAESEVGHTYVALAQIHLAANRQRSAEEYVRKAIARYDLGIEKYKDSDDYSEDAIIANGIRLSKSQALYHLAVAQARSSRDSEALASLEEAYQLAVKFRARPDQVERLVQAGTLLSARMGDAAAKAEWDRRVAR